MTDFFRRTLIIVLQQQKVSENEIFKQIPVSTNGIHQEDFFKVANLNRSTKAAMTGSFRRAHFS